MRLLIILFILICYGKIQSQNDAEVVSDSTLFEDLFKSSKIELDQPINVDAYLNTEITPVLERSLDYHKNLIYCSSFEIAWNGLRDKVVRKPIKLAEEPRWLAVMNKLELNESLSDSSLIIANGYINDGVLEAYNKKLRSRFGYEIEFNQELDSLDLVSLAFVHKELIFKEKLDDKGLTFGFDFRRIKSEKDSLIKIYDYKNEEDFVVQILMEDPNEEFYLVKSVAGKTLLDSYLYAMKRLASDNWGSIGENSSLRIPKIRFNLLRKYSEVEGQFFKNKHLTKEEIVRIKLAEQIIQFNMNESGVTLTSQASLVEEVFAIPSRRIILSPPFLLIQKEKNKKDPYLVMWIANEDLFLKDEDH